MTLLEVRNLSIGLKRGNKIYTAVDRIDFSINAGEIVAFAGESGSGKSLTALSIAQLLPPKAKITGGEIRYCANSIVNVCSLDEQLLCRIRGKEISMIFQEPRQSLNPLMRIGDQIAETLKLHGVDKKTANTEALDILNKLRFPEPEKIIGSWPHQLSGGMCQRVMIAIAAICRPRLLIADEPITALDPVNQNQILSLLNQINHEFGTAILFISHDLSVVQDFCSRFLVMYAGHIIEEGPARAIVSKPVHPYTSGLAGAVPRKENRDMPLAVIPGNTPSLEETASDDIGNKGCSFVKRCSKAHERCAKAFPPWAKVAEDHRVRCFIAESVPPKDSFNG